MPSECAIDTTVLQKANATITQRPRRNSQFMRRIGLLLDIQQGRRIALISRRLLAEYETKVTPPRNDFVKAFFELLANPDRCVENWVEWPAHRRQNARRCRYPRHDDHVLRTAIRPNPSTIITEDQQMLAADACINRHFRVHIESI
jgi:hypothetical protein